MATTNNKKSKGFAISKDLYDLTESQIVNLDQEVTGGEGWSCYCNGFIAQTTVFQNKISGRFRDFTADHYVEVKVGERQITTFCSTCRQGEICMHVVALLYSWVYDSEGFVNVADSLRELELKDKKELIEIIGRMILNDLNNLEIVNDVSDYYKENFDADGFLN